jgi:hypothetical protein
MFYFADDATLIMVDLYVRSFAKIDDVKMEYREDKKNSITNMHCQTMSNNK